MKRCQRRRRKLRPRNNAQIGRHAGRAGAFATFVWAALFAWTGVAVFAQTAAAQQSVADFYKGKTVSLVMGTGPGGSFDVYGRTIAEHFGRHIPGNPNIIVEHMPGAGGVVAGNHIFGPAPQDGTKILLSHPIPLVETLEPGPNIRFQTAKFNWIGMYDRIVLVMGVWHAAPAKNAKELRTAHDTIIGSFAKSHITYQWGVLLRQAVGGKFRVITGYNGGSALNLAMERGERCHIPTCWRRGRPGLPKRRSTSSPSSRSSG